MGDTTSGRDAIWQASDLNSSSPNGPDAERAEADRGFLDIRHVAGRTGRLEPFLASDSYALYPASFFFSNFGGGGGSGYRLVRCMILSTETRQPATETR